MEAGGNHPQGSTTGPKVSTGNQGDGGGSANASAKSQRQQRRKGEPVEPDPTIWNFDYLAPEYTGELIPDEQLQFDDEGICIVTRDELAVANRVLQIFYRFPESAVSNRFEAGTPENALRRRIRVSAMRWLRPGDVPAVKEILRQKKEERFQLVEACGIRADRQRKKRLLPQQIGQVFVAKDDNEFEDLTAAEFQEIMKAHRKPDGEEGQQAESVTTASGQSTSSMDSNIMADATLSTSTTKSSTASSTEASGDASSAAYKYNRPVKENATLKPIPRAEAGMGSDFRVHPSVHSSSLSAKSGAEAMAAHNAVRDERDPTARVISSLEAQAAMDDEAKARKASGPIIEEVDEQAKQQQGEEEEGLITRSSRPASTVSALAERAAKRNNLDKAELEALEKEAREEAQRRAIEQAKGDASMATSRFRERHPTQHSFLYSQTPMQDMLPDNTFSYVANYTVNEGADSEAMKDATTPRDVVVESEEGVLEVSTDSASKTAPGSTVIPAVLKGANNAGPVLSDRTKFGDVLLPTSVLPEPAKIGSIEPNGRYVVDPTLRRPTTAAEAAEMAKAAVCGASDLNSVEALMNTAATARYQRAFAHVSASMIKTSNSNSDLTKAAGTSSGKRDSVSLAVVEDDEEDAAQLARPAPVQTAQPKEAETQESTPASSPAATDDDPYAGTRKRRWGKGKQESQPWTSKVGVYGGAYLVRDENDEEEENEGEQEGAAPMDRPIVNDGEVEGATQDDATPIRPGGSLRMQSENKAMQQAAAEALEASVKAATAHLQAETGSDTGYCEARSLQQLTPCYVCKTRFRHLHHFYDQMCPACAEFNFKKRFQTADMVIHRRNKKTKEIVNIPRVCLVTGARVKIGFEIALKLLRAGAFVIATSRFAHDTALRFFQEPDFDEWKDRLHVYSIDFRVLSAVEMFCAHVLKTYDRLDMIMNNAAQTIRRPPQYYRHLLDVERAARTKLPAVVRSVIREFVPQEFRDEAARQMKHLHQIGFMGNTNMALPYLPTVPALPPTPTPTTATATAPTSNVDVSATSSSSVPMEASTSAPVDTRTQEVETKESTMADDVEAIMTPGAQQEAAAMEAGPTPASLAADLGTQSQSDASKPVNALTLYGDESAAHTARLVTMLAMPIAAAVNPAELTQVAMIEGDEDKEEDKHLFPVGELDKDGQQVDLRPQQTWILTAGEVSTVEMVEVQYVNQMAPFILISKLRPLMKKSGDASWIINVTSMEGKFRGFKDTTHPHTNMAKAALNMLTHTSAKDFAHDRIFMNAVDTGWITEEMPGPIGEKKKKEGFQPPLDEIDGAARCLDPVFTSLLTGVYEFGKFFKDYGEAHW